MIDPVSQKFWLDRVTHEQGFLRYGSDDRFHLLGIAIFMVAVMATAAPVVIEQVRNGRPPAAIVLATALASFVLMLWATRYMPFAFAFVSLLVPHALQHIANSGHIRRGHQSFKLIALCITVAAIGLWFGAAPRQDYHDAVDAMAHDGCADADMSVLKEIKQAHVLAPPLLAMSILKQPFSSNITIGPIPFHRASPATRRLFDALLSPDTTLRSQALEPFDYLAFCRPSEAVDEPSGPLLDALARGQSWPGLSQMSRDDGNRFQLYRLDHQNLR